MLVQGNLFFNSILSELYVLKGSRRRPVFKLSDVFSEDFLAALPYREDWLIAVTAEHQGKLYNTWRVVPHQGFLIWGVVLIRHRFLNILGVYHSRGLYLYSEDDITSSMVEGKAKYPQLIPFHLSPLEDGPSPPLPSCSEVYCNANISAEQLKKARLFCQQLRPRLSLHCIKLLSSLRGMVPTGVGISDPDYLPDILPPARVFETQGLEGFSYPLREVQAVIDHDAGLLLAVMKETHEDGRHLLDLGYQPLLHPQEEEEECKIPLVRGPGIEMGRQFILFPGITLKQAEELHPEDYEARMAELQKRVDSRMTTPSDEGVLLLHEIHQTQFLKLVQGETVRRTKQDPSLDYNTTMAAVTEELKWGLERPPTVCNRLGLSLAKYDSPETFRRASELLIAIEKQDSVLIKTRDKYYDAICNKQWSASYFNRHFNYAHQWHQTASCDLCGVPFNTPYHLYLHKYNKHHNPKGVGHLSVPPISDFVGDTDEPKHRAKRLREENPEPNTDPLTEYSTTSYKSNYIL